MSLMRRSADELRRTARAISGITGSEPTLMPRPRAAPDDRVSKVAKNWGWRKVLWTVTRRTTKTDTALIPSAVLDGAAATGSSCSTRCKGHRAAMPSILKASAKQGYPS